TAKGHEDRPPPRQRSRRAFRECSSECDGHALLADADAAKSFLQLSRLLEHVVDKLLDRLTLPPFPDVEIETLVAGVVPGHLGYEQLYAACEILRGEKLHQRSNAVLFARL